MAITAAVLESQELLANVKVDPDKQNKTAFGKLDKSLTFLKSLNDATPRDEIRKNRQGSSAYDNTPELSHEPKHPLVLFEPQGEWDPVSIGSMNSLLLTRELAARSNAS